GFDGAGTQYQYAINGFGPYNGACLHDNPQTDVWIDFLHHVKFTSDKTGYIETWMRENGGPVKKVLDKHNIAMLWTASDTIYLKMGSYQDPVPGNTAVIHDRLRRGTTAAAISDFDIANAQTVPCANVTTNPGSP